MKTFIGLCGTCFLVILAIGFIFFSKNPSTYVSSSLRDAPEFSSEKYADITLENCSLAPDKISCYEKGVLEFMDRNSMEEAFGITKIIQDRDSSYGYCHSLGHRLGGKETAKNPPQWFEVLSRCPPSGICSSGCMHGVFQQRFRSSVLSDDETELLKADLKKACEPRVSWNPTGLEQGICYHGIGHLLLYAMRADIPRSLQICDEVAITSDGGDYRIVCYEGMFMQLFQPQEAEDFALITGIAPKKEQMRNFCKEFRGTEKQEACWREGWIFFHEEVKTPQGLKKFCSFPSSSDNKTRCYDMVFHMLAQSSQFDEESWVGYCDGMYREHKAQCFLNGALALMQADKRFVGRAVALCSREEILEECYNGLIEDAPYYFHKGSEEFSRFCNALPKVWRSKCFAKEAIL